MKLREQMIRLKFFLAECKRVITLTTKPTKEEFATISKVSGIGLLLIGLIGFLVVTLAQMVK